tara:strand:+ start:202 stop:1110 length:909 start_codon:yes stop_codon:yes gene_type:complete
MGLTKNKKGIVFTGIVIVIITLFLLSFSIISKYQERKNIEKRVDTMNNFLFSVEEDLSRKLFISGFRIIFLLEKEIIESGTYISNVNNSFNEAFFNATINNITNLEISTLLSGVSYPDIISDINQKSNKINVDFSLSNPSLNVDHEDPWNVKVTFSALLSMYDKNNLASWNRTEAVSALIPIEGFEDPTYPIESNNIAIINTITKTPHNPINTNMLDHAQNSYYTNTSEAPSFIDRLEGNLISNNLNGIESFAVPTLPAKSGISIADHDYFSDNAGNQQVSGLPAWFLLDSEHCTIYNVVCS